MCCTGLVKFYALAKHFHILILGGGAAGRWLGEALIKKSPEWRGRIACIERDKHKANDRTWCFWGMDDHDLGKYTLRDWKYNQHNGKSYPLKPYTYRIIRSSDFYQNTLNDQTIIYEEVLHCEQIGNVVHVQTNQSTYTADYVMTSIPIKPLKLSRPLCQSFYGWYMQFDAPYFDDKEIRMMDFSIPQQSYTQFIYVLPLSKTEALVEVTRFANTPISERDAIALRDQYLEGVNFKILDIESGSIPMTAELDAKTKKHPKDVRIIPIGTVAGATKPSTGYTFLRAKAHAENIADALLNDKPIPTTYRKWRFRFYDRLLLDILQRFPEKGKDIFNKLFDNLPHALVLKFLDEQTNILEECRIFKVLPKGVFLRAAIRDLL